jgi:hypothetical protein
VSLDTQLSRSDGLFPSWIGHALGMACLMELSCMGDSEAFVLPGPLLESQPRASNGTGAGERGVLPFSHLFLLYRPLCP